MTRLLPRSTRLAALLAVPLALALTAASCAKSKPHAMPQPAPSVAASPVAALAADLWELLNRPGHQRAQWAVAVRSLRTGEPLVSINAQSLLVPGSSLKVMTAAAAGAAVGWDYTFLTTVTTTGEVHDGVLTGDVILHGSGDPTTDAEGGTDLSGAIAAALRGRGVTRVAGAVVGDAGAFEPRAGLGWSWDDLGTVSGAIAGGLNATENVARLRVSPGTASGAPLRVEPPAADPEMAIAVRAVTGAAGSPRTIWAERRPGEVALTLDGSLAADSSPVTLPVAAGNPTRWAAQVVRSRLIAAGIAVDGPAADSHAKPAPSALLALPAEAPLTEVRSRPLAEIVRGMLKRSNNLYAEALLRLATGPAGSREGPAAITAARDRLAGWGVPVDAVRLADGSGLSRMNLTTAEALAMLLAAQWDEGRSPLAQGLPVAGVDGTLAERMKGTPAAGVVRAKTGTLTGVRSLAGYVVTPGGEPLVFAILCNNFEGPPATVLATLDAMAIRLAAFRR